MRDEQIVHIGRVLFFYGQNAFEHDARRRILIGEETNELPIMLDGDTFCDSGFL